jgi:hypothetical protein
MPRLFAASCAALALAASAAGSSAAVLFEDDFTSVPDPSVWSPFGAGAPEGAGIVGLGEDGATLRATTNPGLAEEMTGYQLATPITLGGLPGLRVEARLAPLNQTPAGDGGASRASIGVRVTGATGAYTELAASANRPTGVDWANVYADSEGSQDFEAAFAHFDQSPPQAAPADGFRTFILDILPTGTRFTVLNTDLTVNSKIGGFNPNLKLSDFGADATIAFFQKRSDSTLVFPPSGPEPTIGDLDRVTASAIPEPTSGLLATACGLVWPALGRRRRRSAS